MKTLLCLNIIGLVYWTATAGPWQLIALIGMGILACAGSLVADWDKRNDARSARENRLARLLHHDRLARITKR